MKKFPMNFKTMFRESGSLYKRNFMKLFLPLLLFQLVLLVPLMFFTMPGTVSVARSLLLTLSQTGGSNLSSVLGVLAIVVCVALFVSPLIVSNVVHVIDSDSHARSITFRDARVYAKKRYGSMLKAYFAVIALFAIPLAAVIAIISSFVFVDGVLLTSLNGGQIALIIVLLLGVLALFFGVVFLPYTVAAQGKSGFKAVFASYRYAFLGNFWSNLTRVLFAALVVVLGGLLINWLSQLPFRELYELYLTDPMLALKNPLMIFVILFALAAIVIVTLVFPFWYAFTYHTYRNAKYDYEKKHVIKNNHE